MIKAKEYVFPMRDWLIIHPTSRVVLVDGMSFNMMNKGPEKVIVLPHGDSALEKTQIKNLSHSADSIFDLSKTEMIERIFKPSS